MLVSVLLPQTFNVETRYPMLDISVCSSSPIKSIVTGISVVFETTCRTFVTSTCLLGTSKDGDGGEYDNCGNGGDGGKCGNGGECVDGAGLR